MFMLVTDGRPYYAVHWVGEEPWPDYVVSNTFLGGEGVTHLLRRSDLADQLASEYEELTTPAPARGCAVALPLLDAKLRISHSPCDWNVRIWRRREAG